MLRQIPAVESVSLFKNTVPVVNDRILLIQIDIAKVRPCRGFLPVVEVGTVINFNRVVFPLPLAPSIRRRSPLFS